MNIVEELGAILNQAASEGHDDVTLNVGSPHTDEIAQMNIERRLHFVRALHAAVDEIGSRHPNLRRVSMSAGAWRQVFDVRPFD